MLPVKLPIRPIRMAKCGMNIAINIVRTTTARRSRTAHQRREAPVDGP